MLPLEKSAVTEGVNEWAGKPNSPPQQRRGGAKRRGGVGPVIDFLDRIFLRCFALSGSRSLRSPRRFAAPLLGQGGEFAFFQFIHTMTDRACIDARTM